MMKKFFDGHMVRAQNVQMQIAVTDVSVPAHFEVGETIGNIFIDVGQKFRHVTDAHRQVVFIRRIGGDRLGDALA